MLFPGAEVQWANPQQRHLSMRPHYANMPTPRHAACPCAAYHMPVTAFQDRVMTDPLAQYAPKRNRGLAAQTSQAVGIPRWALPRCMGITTMAPCSMLKGASINQCECNLHVFTWSSNHFFMQLKVPSPFFVQHNVVNLALYLWLHNILANGVPRQQ